MKPTQEKYDGFEFRKGKGRPKLRWCPLNLTMGLFVFGCSECWSSVVWGTLNWLFGTVVYLS